MTTFAEKAPRALDTTNDDKEHRPILDDIERALGESKAHLTPEELQRILEAKDNDPVLYKLITEAADVNAGVTFADNPDAYATMLEQAEQPKQKLGLVRRLAQKALGVGRSLKALPPALTGLLISKKADYEEKLNGNYASLDDDRRRNRLKKAAWIGNLGALGAGALYLTWAYATKSSGVNPFESAPANVSGAINPDTVTPPSGLAIDSTSDDGNWDALQTTQANRARDPQEYPSLMTFETLEASRHQEVDFLNTNGRHNNDFNNIPVDTLDDPANEGQFPGYEALKNQYDKSPAELSAQLRQIQAIELADGSTFEALPEELRMVSGEDPEAYIARLGEALHGDSDLHDALTTAALDYIKENSQPLRDLTENYSANYIVMVDGQPTVKFDEFVQSADPNDKVLMLSDTEGIRFPCGQCITLRPIQEVEYTPQPQVDYQPQGGPSEQQTIIRRAPGNPSTTTTENPGNPGGGNSGGETPGEETPGGETPNEAKDYSGGVDTADGIDPSKNGFVGWTLDPLESGNGTASANLDPANTPGSETTSQPAEGATTNTDSQVEQQESGAGTNRTEQDTAGRQRLEQDLNEQREANRRAAEADDRMNGSDTTDDAVKRAQRDIGSDGRPKRTASNTNDSAE